MLFIINDHISRFWSPAKMQIWLACLKWTYRSRLSVFINRCTELPLGQTESREPLLQPPQPGSNNRSLPFSHISRVLAMLRCGTSNLQWCLHQPIRLLLSLLHAPTSAVISCVETSHWSSWQVIVSAVFHWPARIFPRLSSSSLSLPLVLMTVPFYRCPLSRSLGNQSVSPTILYKVDLWCSLTCRFSLLVDLLVMSSQT